MTPDEHEILKIMSSNIIGDDKVPPHTRPWLKGLEKLGYVELIEEIKIWHITKEGRVALGQAPRNP